MMGLAVNSERRGDATVVELTGEFDLHSCAAVRSVVDELLEGGVGEIVIDLNGVTFLDSSGLGTLVGLQKRANRAHARMALSGLSPQVGRILDITHLREAFTILPAVSVSDGSSEPSEDDAPA
jgi:anti-anti-sigma factor